VHFHSDIIAVQLHAPTEPLTPCGGVLSSEPPAADQLGDPSGKRRRPHRRGRWGETGDCGGVEKGPMLHDRPALWRVPSFYGQPRARTPGPILGSRLFQHPHCPYYPSHTTTRDGGGEVPRGSARRAGALPMTGADSVSFSQAGPRSVTIWLAFVGTAAAILTSVYGSMGASQLARGAGGG